MGYFKSWNCHWLLRSFGENLSLFPRKLSSLFPTFKCFNARCFPQSYLPLFTPALFGSSFLHLLWVGLCPLTSLLACFPWLSTAVALSAKPLFSSTLLYKLAGCLSQAPARWCGLTSVVVVYPPVRELGPLAPLTQVIQPVLEYARFYARTCSFTQQWCMLIKLSSIKKLKAFSKHKRFVS